jgi:hypothetical protein
MNLCCPTIFAPTAAATGERPSSKKKKNRMIDSPKLRKLVRAKDVWSALAWLEGRIVLFWEKGCGSRIVAFQKRGSGA